MDQRIRRAAYSSPSRFRTYVEIIGQGVGRPIRQQPDGRKEVPDSVTRGLWIHKRSRIPSAKILLTSWSVSLLAENSDEGGALPVRLEVFGCKIFGEQ